MGAHGTCIQCSESANQIYGQLYKNFEPEDYIIGVYSDLED